MKKFICLVLALTCVFALASCGGSKAPVDEFISIVNASAPTRIKTLTSITYDGGDLLEGEFVTVINGQNSTTEYSYDRYAVPGVDESDSAIMTVEGTVYYKDGQYSEDNKTWGAYPPHEGALQITFKLSKKNLGDYTYEDDKLTTTITSEQAKALLGIEISGVSEDGISLTIESNGKYLTRLTITYDKTVGTGENAVTSTVTIKTSYTNTPASDNGDAGEDAAE